MPQIERDQTSNTVCALQVDDS